MYANLILLFILGVFVQLSSCKKHGEESQVQSEQQDDSINQEIASLEHELAQVERRENDAKYELSSLMAVQDPQVTPNDNGTGYQESSYALAEDVFDAKKNKIAGLQREVDELEVRKQEIILAIAKLKVRAGKLTEGQLRQQQNVVEQDQLATKEELEATKKLGILSCAAIHVVEDRVSTQSTEEALEGYRYSRAYKVLTCTVKASTCPSDYYSACRPQGAHYPETEVYLGDERKLSEAQKLVGTPARCSCEDRRFSR